MRFLTGVPALLLLACWLVLGQSSKPPLPISGPTVPHSGDHPSASPPSAHPKEKLTYGVEWRLIRAGTVTVERDPHRGSLHLESAGIVSTLFRVDDVYTVNYEDSVCATSTLLESMERERHHETRVTYDRAHNHAAFIERDLADNMVVKEAGTDIPNCVTDALGAFTKIRAMNMSVGQSAQVPVSDGRRSAMVKVTALEHEGIKTPAGAFQTIRYSADLLNGVVYTRKGEVFVWLTDDSRHLPVQIRLRTTFPISTVTLALEKEEYP
jgi:Protein of unknown function (DUF3108)